MKPTQQPPLPDPGAPEAAPAPLLVAASVVAVEALLLVLYGVAELRSLSSTRLAMGITTSLFFVAYGAGLAVFAWSLRRRQSWARAPVVLAQLIQVCVAWSFRGGGTAFVAAVLLVLGVVALVGIFHPASLRALGDPDED